ncbi:MAG TPA: hypothetical protein VFL94_04220 [Actinomycetales bacterium]|nr:hypothetical protein [Actinomycetales bacterium]
MATKDELREQKRWLQLQIGLSVALAIVAFVALRLRGDSDDGVMHWVLVLLVVAGVAETVWHLLRYRRLVREQQRLP